ncbi:MAG: Gfo/Idh/MocA family oxidoreductase, partial [Calditerricola sp.]|nr:Gfo/Idh/MocA family oxidoreductase [Calditerricola sp.]
MEHRLGIIGAGGIAREVHVPVLRTFSDVKIVAVADVDRAAAERLAGVHGIPHVMTDYRELLARSDVDVVLISTPNHLHAEMAVAALEAGKHVLLEKPMATCAAEAERIAAKARECGRILMVGMNNRFRPDAQQLKRYLEGGAFGDVY